MNHKDALPKPTAWMSKKAEFALKRPWLSWLEGDGSLVIRVTDEPCYFVRILPWGMRMQWGVRQEWTEYGEAERLGWDWMSDELNLVLLSEEWSTKRGLPVWQYTQAIPQQFRETFTPYAYYQSRLLQLISTYSEARELASHNPNLLWLFANLTDRKKVGLPIIRDLLRQRPRVFLSHLLGQDVGEAAVKFLSKVVVTEGSQNCLEMLMSVITHREKVALFAHHWERIPQSAVLLITENASQVLSRCLASELKNTCSYEREAKISKVGSLWDDVRELGGLLNKEQARYEINRMQSVGQLQRLHNRWTDRVIDQVTRELLNSAAALEPFPSSPLKGNCDIIQIHTILELSEESEYMRHCVLSRYESAVQGENYYYRMLRPERCTVEVCKVDNEWHIKEFKLRNNENPSPSSWTCIRRWLDEAVLEANSRQDFMVCDVDI